MMMDDDDDDNDDDDDDDDNDDASSKSSITTDSARPYFGTTVPRARLSNRVNAMVAKALSKQGTCTSLSPPRHLHLHNGSTECT